MSELELPPSTPESKTGLQLLAILTLCYLVSFASIEGALRGLGDWYPVAVRPPWAPPIWLFAPMWTVLYGMQAASLWQVWSRRSKSGRAALGLFGAQLLLNGAWPWIFFAYHSFLFSIIEIVAVWLLMGFTIWAFGRIRISAACLLVPYWVWVAFCAALTFAVYRLNK